MFYTCRFTTFYNPFLFSVLCRLGSMAGKTVTRRYHLHSKIEICVDRTIWAAQSDPSQRENKFAQSIRFIAIQWRNIVIIIKEEKKKLRPNKNSCSSFIFHLFYCSLRVFQLNLMSMCSLFQ